MGGRPRNKGGEAREPPKEKRRLPPGIVEPAAMIDHARRIIGRPMDLKRELRMLHDQLPMCTAFCNAYRGKNRYPELLVLDRSRVILNDVLNQQDPENFDDYINANWVDGWERPYEYILTPSPLGDRNLETDFWRMILFTRAPLIVYLEPQRELPNDKAHAKIDPQDWAMMNAFWPTGDASECQFAGGYLTVVRQSKPIVTPNCDIFPLVITQHDKADPTRPTGQAAADAQKGECWVHPFKLVRYREWANDEVPSNIIDFWTRFRLVQADQLKKFTNKRNVNQQPPCVIMCSTGVHKSGTFLALDICLKRVTTERTITIIDTARVLRQQRYGCLQSIAHYMSITETVVNQSLQNNWVNSKDLAIEGGGGNCMLFSDAPSNDDQQQQQ